MDPTRSARSARALLLLSLIVSLGTLAPLRDASAIPISFTKIADTATPIPGGSGSFTSFGRNPSVDAGAVAFRGEGDPPSPLDAQQQGIYTGTTSGGLAVVADGSTAIPGGAGSFETFAFKPSIDGGAVAWNGDGSAGQEGIYQDTGTGAVLVADRNTLLPGGQTGERFDLFVHPPTRDGGTVVFYAQGDGGVSGPDTEGLYTNAGGSLAAIADTGTTMPGTAETFAFVSSGSIDGGTVAFRGTSGTGFQGVYRHDGTLATVVDENTLAPSGASFLSFGGTPVISGGAIAFRGTDTNGLTGLFVEDGGLTLVADENTLIPGGGGSTFNIFSNYAIDHDTVVFEGIGVPGSEVGIYAWIAGALHKIIDLGDTLDGKSLAELEISSEAISGDEVVFWTRFTDGSEGVFVAAIPEPTTGALLALGLVALAARRARR